MVQMDGKEGKAMDTNMGGSPGYWNQSQLLGNSPNEEVRGHWTPAGCGLKDIQYKKYINKVVSQAALKKLQNHMWYLGSEMAPLSLFSSKVCDKEKKSIVGAMILSEDDCNVLSFIHFYSAPSSPLLLRGAPDYSTDTVSEFHAKRTGNCR